MRNTVLLPKRIIKKIGLSAATIALGAILWASIPQTTAAEENPCVPGTHYWPQCLKEEGKGIAEIYTIQDFK